MDDERITDLFRQRDEEALVLTEQAYGSFLLALSRRILGNEEDARECVNDCLLEAWNSIPPHEPANLENFLGRIVRRRAIDRLRRENSLKRGGGEAALALEEFENALSAAETPESALEHKELAGAVQDFVRSLKQPERDLFVRRYWFLDTEKELAARWQMSRGQVAMKLSRTRRQLAEYLKKKEWIE